MRTVITTAPIEERKKLQLRAGDTVRVTQKIVEIGPDKGKEKGKEKTRLQAFEGLVLAVKHGKEAGATFTVRKVASGVGVEKIFPLYLPSIEKIEILRSAKVRRAKLYHIRDKVSREVRREMRNLRTIKVATEDSEEAATPEVKEIKSE
ncbi:MAG: 50S ribosomal protein L19 [Patescibacteria group bacterium]